MDLRVICTLVYLGGSGWKDLKSREIPLALPLVYGIGGILCSVLQEREITDWMLPAGLGAFFVALGFLTEGAVGIGDGWVLLALGCLLHTDEYLKTIAAGFLLASFWSAILLVFCKKNRKTEIPLVPFLFLGYVGGLFL